MEFDGAADPHRVEGKDEPKFLPPEVMEMIIEHCKAPVLLQLRLVSLTMKTLVDTSTNFKELLNTLEVNLHVSTLEEFVTSAPSLPFSRFSIDLSPPTRPERSTDSTYLVTDFQEYRDIHFPPFYADSPHLQTFKQKFCPKIRRLRLSAFFCGTTELDFLESLEVLEELEIELLRLSTPENSEAGPSLEVKSPRIPNLPALKRLSFSEMERFTHQDYLTNWIASCPSLVHLKLPLLHEASSILRLGSTGHLPFLQRLHLNSGYFEIQQFSEEDLRFLGELTSRRDFRFEGVSANLISSVINASQVPLELKRGILSSVAATKQLWELMGELEHLEELQFGLFLPSFNLDVGPQELEIIFRLPSLKKITAEIMEERDAEVFPEIMERLFRPTLPRLSVTHLDITYSDDIPPGRHFPRVFPPTFISEHLHLGFPNLQKLRLTLPGSAIDRMVDLFDVLSEKSFLEELHLCSYDGITETTFTRRNPPGLLRLQHLKKFRLHISSYPEETAERMGDGILEVIAEMTLTHLHISGEGWTNVTGDGLRTLTEGPLGQTILWTQLKDVGASLEAEERREVLEGLSRVCHTNRFARGLTSVSFQQFQASEAAFLITEHPFRHGGWTDQEFNL